MKILNKRFYLYILLWWHLTQCDSQNAAVQHLNLQLNRLNRITNSLQRDVNDIWTAISNIVVQDSSRVNLNNDNKTEPENPSSEEVLKLVNETVSEVKDLKAEVEGLIVFAHNGLKNEKALSREILNEIQTSQTEHESLTSNEIEEMKKLLKNLEKEQRKAMDDQIQNFKVQFENDKGNLLEQSQNTTNKCQAKSDKNTVLIEENKSDIQAINDKLELVDHNLASVENYVKKTFKKLQEAIPCDFPWENFGDHCYLLSSGAMSWSNAWEFCSSQGSYLVEIDNTMERDFLVGKCKKHDIVWIGANDKKTEGSFVWETSKMTIPADYFAPGEPNGGRHENCVHLYGHGSLAGKLNDIHCGSLYRFLCEKSKIEL